MRESFAHYPSLREAVVLITGGESGIGASMVEHLDCQGARVAFVDVNAESAAKLLGSIPAATHTPRFFHCDLTDVAAVRAAVAKVEAEIGPVRVLVNNAARDDRLSFADVTHKFIDGRIAVNILYQFIKSQLVVPGMIREGYNWI